MGDRSWVKVPAMEPQIFGRSEGTLWASDGTGTLLLTGHDPGRLQVERSERLIQEIPFIIPTPCGLKDPDNEKASEKGLERGH